MLFAPAHAPPVAFVAGVAGPLIGADLLRLREIERMGTAVASIGGAGTFDGIVISGLVATLLAPASRGDRARRAAVRSGFSREPRMP